MVKFSRTLFIMYFSGRCLSLWMKLIIYSHMGERWMRYKHFPPSTRANSVCKSKQAFFKREALALFSHFSGVGDHTHLHFFHHLLPEGAHFGWDGDGHVLWAAVLTADSVEGARSILDATVIQIRLRKNTLSTVALQCYDQLDSSYEESFISTAIKQKQNKVGMCQNIMLTPESFSVSVTCIFTWMRLELHDLSLKDWVL